MKTRKNPFLPLAALTLLSLSPTLHAAPLTWTGGAGTWQVGDAGQWGSAWANGDTATFSGAGGAIILGSAITTGSAPLAFNNGNYSISAGAPLVIALGGGTVPVATESNVIRLGAVNTTIGSNVTLNRDTWIIDGATTASSTFNLTGGSLVTVSANPNTIIQEATVNVNTGSLLRTGGSLICGTTSNGAALNVSGGTVTIEGSNNSLLLANSGATASTVTVTLSSGAINFTNGSNPAGLRYATQTGIFNLDGGVITVGRVFESGATATSTFNFNGGTLRARRNNTTDFMAGLNNAVVKSGGAIIDTNGSNITIGQALTPGSPNGGLTKNGLGTLTLSGASTYTGATSVTAGRLDIGGSLVSNVSVAANATLGGEGSVSGTGITSFATSGATFAFNPTTAGAFTASSLNLGSSVIQLASDGAMTNGTLYLVMTNSAGFSGTANFRSPSRGVLAVAGNNLNFTPSASAIMSWKGSDGTNPTLWDTETTANWDNGGATDRFFNLDSVLFDDTASSYSVAISGGTVRPASVTFNNTTTYTLSGGAIAGTTGIIKNGAGIVTLGNANTYSGNTEINEGTVQVSGGSAISDTGLVFLADTTGVSFGVLGTETIGAISGGGATGGNISINSAQTLSLGSGTQSYGGTIGGLGALTNTGAVQNLDGVVSNSGGINATSGRLTLGANNTYTGVTTVAANSGIIVTNANGLGATGSGNGTTILGAGNAASGQIGLSSDPMTAGITVTEKVIGSGMGHITPATVNGFAAQQRGMIQSVSGDNTFAGDIEINSGGLTRFGTQDGAKLTLSGTITRSVGVTDIRVLFRAGGTAGDFVTLTSTGNDFDECALFSTAPGNAGLRLGADNALPVVAPILAANFSSPETTLDLDGYEQTIGGLTTAPGNEGQYKIINRNLVNPSTLTLANTADTSSSLGAISNDGSAAGVINVVKTGVFAQGLGAANTYTGTTLIEGGRLDFLQQASLYNNTPTSWTPAKITVNSSAALGLSVGGLGEFTGTDVETIITNLTASNGNGLKGGSSLFLNATADTSVTTPLTDSTGTTGGAIGLEKTGAAKLTLSAANTYSGNTTVSAGTLQLDAPNAANNGSTVTLASTATLALNFGGSDTVDKLFIGGFQRLAGVYRALDNPGADFQISQITGTGTLTVLSSPTGYLGWAAANAPGQGPELDHDDDGTLNGIEYFMGETGSTFTANPAPSGGAIVWPMGATYSGTYGTDFEIETSGDLVAWTQGTIGVGPGTVQVVPGVSVTYTLPTGAGPHFVRLQVNPE